MFGVQSQIGPIFHPRVQFRPNAEFAFGEVTDLVALNLEGVYRFSSDYRKGNWIPYIGAGPAMIFIHQNFQRGRQIDFGNFDYEIEEAYELDATEPASATVPEPDLPAGNGHTPSPPAG